VIVPAFQQIFVAFSHGVCNLAYRGPFYRNVAAEGGFGPEDVSGDT